MPLFETITDLSEGAETLRRRRYGVIEVAAGRLTRIRLRPWPKIATVPGILLFGGAVHRFGRGDRVWLYYNQPRSFPQFLVLKYLASTGDATMATVRLAHDVLEQIARIKRSDAMLCDVANWRISTRLMERYGWQPHCPSWWHRHYIKRFYGEYPPRSAQPLSRHLRAAHV